MSQELLARVSDLRGAYLAIRPSSSGPDETLTRAVLVVFGPVEGSALVEYLRGDDLGGIEGARLREELCAELERFRKRTLAEVSGISRTPSTTRRKPRRGPGRWGFIVLAIVGVSAIAAGVLVGTSSREPPEETRPTEDPEAQEAILGWIEESKAEIEHFVDQVSAFAERVESADDFGAVGAICEAFAHDVTRAREAILPVPDRDLDEMLSTMLSHVETALDFCVAGDPGNASTYLSAGTQLLERVTAELHTRFLDPLNRVPAED